MWYQSMGEIVEDAILFEASIGTVWLLCQKPFVKFTVYVTHLQMPFLEKICNISLIRYLEKTRGIEEKKKSE